MYPFLNLVNFSLGKFVLLWFLFVKPLVPFAQQIELLAIEIPFLPQEEEGVEMKSKKTRSAPDIAGEMTVLALHRQHFSLQEICKV